ncbi:uncharacterized protein [Macrobrachium rosenbergii]|uniref:uncharacterized protein n=1 Tax=Macrobrachium rosenbergii TaxID=79674 RepID=UPI0034D56638
MYNNEINLLFMKFLLPLLEKFQTMNLKFQAQNPDPSKFFKELSDFQCDIMSRVVNPNRMSQKTNWEDHIMHTDACFYGAEFQMACSASQLPEATKADIKERCRQFLVEAVREIKKRVPVSGNHLELLSLLAPTDISELSFTKIVPELKRMTECSVGTLENQWRARKFLAAPPSVMCDTVKYWIYLLNNKDSAGNHGFRELAAVALSLLSLPIANAECERVFSQVNILKNDLRNRLSTDTLDNLLNIRFSVRGHDNDCCESFHPDNKMLEKFCSDIYE